MNLAINSFKGGLNMDFDPLITPNSVLTNCLNGTYLTFDGHEALIQNDMGNGRVETASLPTGYIPVGTTSFGGIIYIVSYNPLIDLCQIGCFPSPERNISYLESYNSNGIVALKKSDFIDENDNVILTKKKIKISNITLNPGDKYRILATNLENNKDYITDYGSTTKILGGDRKFLRLRVATLDASNRLVYLDSNVKWFNLTSGGNYYIKETSDLNNPNALNSLDSNSKVSSEYNIYDSKLSGELYLVAELELIDNFSYSYSVIDKELNLHFTWTDENWNGQVNPSSVLFKSRWKEENVEPTVYDEINDLTISDPEHSEVNKYSYKYNVDTGKRINKDIGYLYYSLTPKMKYGDNHYCKLNDLTLKGCINLENLGTGETDISIWKYYKSDDYITLLYGFEDYPEDGKMTYGIRMQFFEVNDLINAGNFNTPNYTYLDTTRASYSGQFSHNFSFIDDDDNTEGLKEDKLYVVKISKAYGPIKDSHSENYDSYPVGIRFLYTNTIFNDYYYDEDDYNTLKITFNEDNLDFETTNYLTQTSEIISPTHFSKSVKISDIEDKFVETKNSGSGTVVITPQINEFTSDLINLTAEVLDNPENLNTAYSNFISQYNITKSGNSISQEGNIYSINYDLRNKLPFTDLAETELQFTGKLQPLLYTEDDLDSFGLEFDDTNHFMFGSYIAMSDSGALRTVDFHNNLVIDANNKYHAGFYTSSETSDLEKYATKDHGTTENLTSDTTTKYSAIDAMIKEYYSQSSIAPISVACNFDRPDDDKNMYSVTLSNCKSKSSCMIGDYSPTKPDKTAKNGLYNGIIWTEQEGMNKDLGFTYDTTSGNKRIGTYSDSVSSKGFGGITFQSTLGTFYMTNNFFYLYDKDGIVTVGNTIFTPGDILASLLSQIYKFTEDDSQTELKVPIIETNNTLTYTLSIPVTTKVTGNFSFDVNSLKTLLSSEEVCTDNITFDIGNILSSVDITFENKDLAKDECSNTVSSDLLLYRSDSKDSIIIKKDYNIPLTDTTLYYLDGNNYYNLKDLTETESKTKIWTSNGTKYTYTDNYISSTYFKFPKTIYEEINNDKDYSFFKFTPSTEGLYPKGLNILTLDDGLLKINSPQYKSLPSRSINFFASGDDSRSQTFKGFALGFSIAEIFTINPSQTIK